MADATAAFTRGHITSTIRERLASLADRPAFLPFIVSILGLSVVGLALIVGRGAGGVGYLIVFALATVPGWPIGFALFGRRHAAGWWSGAALGYGLTALVLWAVMRAGIASGTTLTAGWLLLTGVTWGLFGRRHVPAVELPAWSRRDWQALALVLLLVPALAGPPFANVGRADEAGTRRYRAYFTADFIWHVALTSELTRFEVPPANPYRKGEALHYYWAYFLLPASVAGTRPPAVTADVERALLLNALCAGLLLVSSLFLLAWTAVPRRVAVAVAVLLAAVAASAEGTYAIYNLIFRSQPLSDLQDLNIDAITYWTFRGLTIDGVPRAIWYNAHHSFAATCGIVALVIAGTTRATLAGVAGAGLALGLAVMISPFPGAAFALAYGIAAVGQSVRLRSGRPVLLHSLAAVPVLLAIGWCLWNDVLSDARGAVHLGYAGQVRYAPLATPILALGPLLTLALLGLWPPRRVPPGLLPSIAAVVTGFALFYLVSLGSQDPMYVGFRAGQMVLFCLAPAAAWCLARWFEAPRGPVGLDVLLLLFAVGLPTTLIDVYNAQDITNERMGPDAPWTLTIPAAESAAFAWIETHTPRDAIVQMEIVDRGRGNWSLIPSFAHRRMAAGLPISQLETPETRAAAERVHRMYDTLDAKEAWETARDLGIEYVFVGDVEHASFERRGGLAKFGASGGGFFRQVFANEASSVYAVRK